MSSESRWQLGQCQLTPSQAGHLSPKHPVPQPAPPLPLSILPLHPGLAAKCPLQPKAAAFGLGPGAPAPFPKVNDYSSFLSVPQ